MSLPQFCVRWNNHLKIFQSALPKYYLNQRYLDCTLVAEGRHLVPCHRMVLDACSDYFANFLKNKIFDDKNLVICLPKEIRLWQIQAILQFMYRGEVCISQEGLPSLVKCAELLQVKGLCGSDPTTITSNENDQIEVQPTGTDTATEKPLPPKENNSLLTQALQKGYNRQTETTSHTIEESEDEYCPELASPAIEIDENDSETEVNGQIIKRELNINDVMDDDDEEDDSNGKISSDKGDDDQSNPSHDVEQIETLNSNLTISSTSPQSEQQQQQQHKHQSGLIRVKSNLFEQYHNIQADTSLDTSNQEFEDADASDGSDMEEVDDPDDEKEGFLANSLVYNKNSMDIYVKRTQNDIEVTQQPTKDIISSTATVTVRDNRPYEDIICAPNIMEFDLSEAEEEIEQKHCINGAEIPTKPETMTGDLSKYFSSIPTVAHDNALYDMITQSFACEETSFIPINGNNANQFQNNSSLFIASVSSLNKASSTKKVKPEDTKLLQSFQKLTGGDDTKASIGGLYLRNPRGNQIRQYDTSMLYSALQDVKNGHSIYRAAQRYSIPRKTLRNWMKRLHIKSAYPMPRQLQAAAERKKSQKNASLMSIEYAKTENI